MQATLGQKQKRSTREKQQMLALLLSLFFLLLLAMLGILSEGSRGGADDLSHYKFSRYAFQYPELLLDHWAKPVYTLIAAPFAQFGYNGVRLLNALLAALSGYLIFAGSRRKNYSTALWGIVLCLTAPLYFVLAYSGMTEILFGLLLLLSTLWMLESKYLAAALLLSFLPLVRTESVVLLPLYIAAFLLLRKYRYLPFLLTGFLLYSVVGGLVYDDFFWLINRMPYTGAGEIYGSGDLWHFVRNSPRIFGYPLLLFFLTGFFLFIVHFFRHIRQREVWIRLLLIWAPIFLFFAAHSWVWWQGRGGSAGLLRVMVCIVPLMSLAAMDGLETLYRSLQKPAVYRWLAGISVVALLYWQLQLWYPHPHPADGEMKTVQEACAFVKENGLDTGKIWYYNPYVFHYLQLNPWDHRLLQERVPDPANPSAGLAAGDVIIWDAHFGPNEGGLPLERLTEDPNLRKLKTILPPYNFETGGIPYTVELFRKMLPGQEKDSSGMSTLLSLPHTEVMDFEAYRKGDSLACDTTTAYEGKYSYHLNKNRQFSPSLDIYGWQLGAPGVYKVSAALAYLLPSLPAGEVVLVLSVENQRGEVYIYQKALLSAGGNWQESAVLADVQIRNKGDILKTYVWSTEGAEVWMDNLKMEVRAND